MKLWTRLNFSRKLAVCLFLANILATSLGIMILYGSARNEALRMNMLLNENNLTIAKKNIEGTINAAENSAISIFFEHSVKNQILGDFHFTGTPESFNEVNTQLLRVLNTTPSIRALSIYKRNGSSISTNGDMELPFSGYDSLVEHCAQQGIALRNTSSSSFWSTSLVAETQNGYQSSFVNLRELKDVNAKTSNAIMLVYLKENTIYDMYSFFGQDSFMMDEKGIVVSAGDKSRIGRREGDTPIGHLVLDSGREPVSLPYDDNGSHYFSSIYLPRLSCYLVAVPSYDILAETQNAMGLAATLLVGLSVLISILLAHFISRGMTTNIRNLKQVMESNEGDLSARFNASGSDEINYLGNTFNTLMDRIESYIQEVNDTQNRKRASDLQLLQSQINPHLLYNTLDSVMHSLSHNDTHTARQTLELLSDFFKISLSQGQAFVPIRSELLLTKKYIELQRICRGKQVQLQVGIEQGLQDKLILKTVIQPIVENIYMHAFVGAVEDGEIDISIHRTPNNGISIAIADNGIGMSDKALQLLREQLRSDEPTGSYGLWNVNQRLVNHYGREYGLRIQSEFGEGTRVSMFIPYPGPCSIQP